MKKYLLLYAMYMMAFSLWAHTEKATNFEDLMRMPRITETNMVSYPGA